MNVRERVARAWHAGSDHAADEPFGGPLCNCLTVAGRIMPMLRKTYDDGWFSAIGSSPDDVWFDAWADDDSNPYKEDRHVEQ